MCGIAGLWADEEFDLSKQALLANKLQMHRGPDAQSSRILDTSHQKLLLVHQRLSILDLSPSGDQPMESQSSRWVIVYNGEIYNFGDLRAQLEACGVNFSGSGDTEVLVAAIENWGFEEAIKKANGMFAIAAFDKQTQNLFLCRDRLGKKPLYWHGEENFLAFASEIKTILHFSQKKFNLDYQYLGEIVMQTQYNTGTHTPFKEISCIPPGSIVRFSLAGKKFEEVSCSYWSLESEPETTDSYQQCTEEVRSLLTDSITARLRSDVPVGVMLSGGVDSSIIASIAKENSGSVRFLSGVSKDKDRDESPFIDLWAKSNNATIDKIVVEDFEGELFGLLEELTFINDQPLGHVSNVTHNLLMKIAQKNGVKVVLTGQGADEIFCGYRKYLFFYLQALSRKGNLLQSTKSAFDFWRNGTVFQQFNFAEASRYIPSILGGRDSSIRGPALEDYQPLQLGLGADGSMQARRLADLKRFSLPSLLHIEDRMGMAASVEVRAPFVDYKLIEYARRLPASYLLRDGWTKSILRDAFKDKLPSEIAWRKDKQGFVSPQDRWLKTSLKGRILDDFLGSESLIFKHGLVDQAQLLERYQKFSDDSTGSSGVFFREILGAVLVEIWMRLFRDYY